MSEQLDTFADPTPIAPAASGGVAIPPAPEMDTFDDPTPIVPETQAKEGEGEEQKPSEEESTAKDPETKGQTEKLPQQEKDSESEDDKEEETDGGDDKEKEGDSELEGEGDDASKTPEEKPKGKTIRLKEGDSKYDISLEATIPVKVKGKKEFVSLEELRSNYSGHKAWSDEMATLSQQRDEQAAQIQEFESAKESTKQHFGKIGEMLEDAFSNPEADPLAAMKYLVELGGRDVLEFEQKLMEHYTGVVSSFNEMDESEQKLYWAQRENDLLRSNQTTQAKLDEERKATEQRDQKTGEVREKFGISEAEFDAAKSEIVEFGANPDEVSTEQIAKWAALKPHVVKSEELCKQFEEDLTTDQFNELVTGAAQTMFENPKMDHMDCLHFAAKKLGFKIETEEDLVRSLKERAEKQTPKTPESKKSNYKYGKSNDADHVESFDDYDNEIYRRS